ncbi:hypothetical protein DFR67_108179 [Williamsia limnetica]|uniref:Uncharacterized protein n=2 Tax=Williamsia limnetica TaxID=882452 RepID=A0A318RH88_WILLI|nr:hypothetical protein DFR67_108179 [Williamsia limnetica]
MYILVPMFIGLLMVFVENAKKTAHLPRAPFGADAEVGPQEMRRWAEIDELERQREG